MYFEERRHRTGSKRRNLANFTGLFTGFATSGGAVDPPAPPPAAAGRGALKEGEIPYVCKFNDFEEAFMTRMIAIPVRNLTIIIIVVVIIISDHLYESPSS